MMSEGGGLEREAFTRKLGRQALKLANQPGSSKSQLARELGLHPNILNWWA